MRTRLALFVSGCLLAGPASAAGSYVDLNGDGKTDLVWRNGSTRQTVLWLLNGLSMTAWTSVSIKSD